ncbi:uncharacterized protein LOC143031996 isoform X1 [Oratosquilla oratoria]|uniref:uncharacterized protein LOC143031996 isoform X1 n=1 Tax=Oratosquilla oratoria TaxID=337810 RepID=UPI003F75C120
MLRKFWLLVAMKSPLSTSMPLWESCPFPFFSGLELESSSCGFLVPVGFLEKMREFEFPHLDRLITIVDLIDAPLDMSGIEKLPERIQSVVAWDAHQSFPWINWHVATLAAGHSSPGAQHYSSIGATIFLLTLPGTVSVHYGDEINLHGPKQGKVEPHNWTSIMQWTDQKFAGFSTTDPWKSLSPGWDFNNVYNHNHTIEPVRQMIKLRQEKVPIYVNGIFNYEGDYHPTKSTNYKFSSRRSVATSSAYK